MAAAVGVLNLAGRVVPPHHVAPLLLAWRCRCGRAQRLGLPARHHTRHGRLLAIVHAVGGAVPLPVERPRQPHVTAHATQRQTVYGAAIDREYLKRTCCRRCCNPGRYLCVSRCDTSLAWMCRNTPRSVLRRRWLAGQSHSQWCRHEEPRQGRGGGTCLRSRWWRSCWSWGAGCWRWQQRTQGSHAACV